MTNQRGNIYLYLAAAAVILGLIVSLFFGYKSQLDGADEKGYERGKTEVDAAYKARDNKQLQAVIAERDQLLEEKAKREARHAAEFMEAEEQHENDLQANDADHDRIVRGLRKQRDEARALAAKRGEGTGGQAAADLGGRALDDWRTRLSDADVQFLIGESRRANIVLARVRECRAEMEAERR